MSFQESKVQEKVIAETSTQMPEPKESKENEPQLSLPSDEAVGQIIVLPQNPQETSIVDSSLNSPFVSSPQLQLVAVPNPAEATTHDLHLSPADGTPMSNVRLPLTRSSERDNVLAGNHQITPAQTSSFRLVTSTGNIFGAESGILHPSNNSAFHPITLPVTNGGRPMLSPEIFHENQAQLMPNVLPFAPTLISNGAPTPISPWANWPSHDTEYIYSDTPLMAALSHHGGSSSITLNQSNNGLAHQGWGTANTEMFWNSPMEELPGSYKRMKMTAPEGSSQPVLQLSLGPTGQGSAFVPRSGIPQVMNSVYDPKYEAMGLPIDPHLRMFKLLQEKEKEKP